MYRECSKLKPLYFAHTIYLYILRISKNTRWLSSIHIYYTACPPDQSNTVCCLGYEIYLYVQRTLFSVFSWPCSDSGA